jgi:hypothetical protein
MFVHTSLRNTAPRCSDSESIPMASASGEQYLWPAHDVPVKKRPAKAAETSCHAARPPEAAASQRATLPAEKRHLVLGCVVGHGSLRISSLPTPPRPLSLLSLPLSLSFNVAVRVCDRAALMRLARQYVHRRGLVPVHEHDALHSHHADTCRTHQCNAPAVELHCAAFPPRIPMPT